MLKRIAVITSVRNGAHFLDRWIAYYGGEVGFENLYIIVDGLDQPTPDPSSGVNILPHPYEARSRSAGDKFRAARASDLAASLFETYDIVIGTDVDEFIVVDPAISKSLAAYLFSVPQSGVLSAMGVDVACNTRQEKPLDWDAPFLGQRQFGQISDRYTKASIMFEPLRWGSGQHRVRGRGFTVDPHLVLFHFGSVDDKATDTRTQDAERNRTGWAAHQRRRNAVVTNVSTSPVIDGDVRFRSARKMLSRPRAPWAWNKPRPLRVDDIVQIPDRFFGIV